MPKALKIIFLFFGFWILSWLEMSFFSFLNVFGWHFHLIWLLVFLINLFEDRYGSLGLWSAAFGGFFLDIYSPLRFFGFDFFGTSTLILFFSSFILKFIILRYVEFSAFKRSKKV